MKLLRTDRTVLFKTCTSTRKGLACVRMKLYSNHMRRRVSLYVLYRTQGKNQGGRITVCGRYFGLSCAGTSLTPGKIVMVELNFL